jgi:hypothetical protein
MPTASPHGPAPTTATSQSIHARSGPTRRRAQLGRQRLLEVCDEVGGILDAERETDEAGSRCRLLRRSSTVSPACDVKRGMDTSVSTPPRLGATRHQPQPLQHTQRGVVAAAHHQRRPCRRSRRAAAPRARDPGAMAGPDRARAPPPDAAPATRATARPFALWRSMRTASVLTPRSSSQTACGSRTGPKLFSSSFTSATVGPLPSTTPAVRSEWPPRYFVALWNTRSAPCSSGRKLTGVANVASTMSGTCRAAGDGGGGREVRHAQRRVDRHLHQQRGGVRPRRASPSRRRRPAASSRCRGAATRASAGGACRRTARAARRRGRPRRHTDSSASASPRCRWPRRRRPRRPPARQLLRTGEVVGVVAVARVRTSPVRHGVGEERRRLVDRRDDRGAGPAPRRAGVHRACRAARRVPPACQASSRHIATSPE